MFLRELNNTQKNGFWKLANKLVFIDGKIEKSEKRMLEEYNFELGLAELEIKDYPDDVEKILSDMELDKRLKKIVMFELIGLAFSDDYYDQSEKELLIDIQNKIGLSETDVTELGKFVNEVLALYSKIGDFINE
ncbi:MAG: hypothetical protein K6F55_05325 [Eubacterium sp.]|nr:hypothetical protein [Eubacterium sp.]